ncbi:hypothetical protein GCM10011521_12000 [Arenimonas soli]|uniref:Uncharacterized protein n=1 Tax=Arenimonas soli TaxID=2269504 RepID=A0ABQ1HGV8_9GAMM|nr:hypothetical protein GCM10011521_12000 [Arenimonas soli]
MSTLGEAAWARLRQLAACSLGYFLRGDKGANLVIAAGQVAPAIAPAPARPLKMPTPASARDRQTRRPGA